MSSRLKTISMLTAIVILCAFLTYSFVSPKGFFSRLQGDLKNIEPAAEFAYTDLDGNTVLLSSVKGKPLVVNSWATWMPFSKDELILLNELKKQHGDKLEILAINRMEDREFIKSYLSTFGIERIVTFLTDPSDTFYKAISGYAMPETVFYTYDGTISFHKRGVLTEDEISEQVKNILD